MSDIIDRTRAAGMLIGGMKNEVSKARSGMFAFLSIHHPELSLKKRLDLANDAALRKEGV